MNDEIEREDEKLNPKHRGLGRGLNALFEDEEDEVLPQVAVEKAKNSAGRARPTLSVDQLVPNMRQPRSLFKDETIQELANSISEHGILQPLMVRPIPGEPDLYQIIAGERRWRAAQIAQLHDVPVIITDYDDAKTAEIALIENLQREDLNPIDEAAGYQYMIDEYGYTQDLLAKKMGKSRSHISNTLRLNTLSDRMAVYLSHGDISMGHARALLTMPDADALCDEIVAQGLSVRDTEKMVARLKGKAEDKAGEANLMEGTGITDEMLARSKKVADEYYGTGSKGKGKPKASKPEKDEDTIALEQRLERTLGLNVSIDVNHANIQEGELRISYKSLDQLEEMINLLTGVNNMAWGATRLND